MELSLIYELSCEEVNKIELFKYQQKCYEFRIILYPSWYQTACPADSFSKCSQTWYVKSGSTEHSEKSFKDIHVLQVFNMTIKPIEYSNFPPLK